MSDLKSILPKIDRQYLANPRRPAQEDLKQRKLMLGSLCLLLVALGIALYHNRDFWFPDSEDADSDQVAETAPQVQATRVQPAAPTAKSASTAMVAAKPKHQIASAAKAPAPATPTPPAAMATTTRTVLPPLDVEVVGAIRTALCVPEALLSASICSLVRRHDKIPTPAAAWLKAKPQRM